ncbi:MAG: hypothetical protein NVS1B4_22260 [Gemmatimonadaceae bacterium]
MRTTSAYFAIPAPAAVSSVNRRPRRGMALLSALVVLIIVGALIGGAFLASVNEVRNARTGPIQARAFNAAEYGLNAVLGDWDPRNNQKMQPGDTLQFAYNIGGATSDTVKVTKLNKWGFVVISEGWAGNGTGIRLGARRRSGTFARLAYPQVPYGGAMTVAGPLTLDGGAGNFAVISGVNQDPNWNGVGNQCTFAGSDSLGIASPNTALINFVRPGIDTLQGMVPGGVGLRPAAGLPATYTNFGSETYSSMAATAQIQLPAGASVSPAPVVVGSTCPTTSTSNWGDLDHSVLTNPCQYYFPIIHANGDLTVSNGSGQGVLLVDGSLNITGNFRFYGVIVVSQYLQTSGLANRINGATLIAGTNPAVGLGKSVINGDTRFRKSTCSIEVSSRGASYLKPAKERSWSDMF